MRDKSLETMNDDQTIAEEIGMRDLHSVHENLTLVIVRDGEAAVGGQGFDFGAEY